jgi:site-specific DNA-methyltransferase (adenine-specific)
MNYDYIKQGDCLELMKEIPGGSIDLTVTSPPYDNLRNYNGNIDQWCFEKFQRIAEELYRITKEGGVVVWIVADATIKGSETCTSFKQALFFKECGFRLYDTMIWTKPSPQAPTEGRYYDTFEYMFIFSKGKPKTLNLLSDRKNKSCGMKSKKETRSCREDRRLKDGIRVVKEYSRRFNVWEISRGHNKTKHPAVFPENLARDHIISWSNDGDVVFDPFLGSGTTAKMAILNNRHYIGFELDKKYFDMAQKRIWEAGAVNG